LVAAVGVTAVCADTILFPVISYNVPNVTSVITVLNRTGSSSTHLRYTYRYKTTSNIGAVCQSASFVRPTFAGDLVTFDPSGNLNGGNAMFGDTNSYGGGFAMGVAGPLRAYLLVSHADAVGNRQNVGNNQNLGGEALNLDIGTGAAWGMKGINDNSREDYTFVNADDGGGVFAALPSNGFTNRRLMFFPPSKWKTRMFVTPIGANMNTANVAATVALHSDDAVVDRNGTQYTFPRINRDVTCTGAIDLQSLFNSTVWAAVENLGGWTWLGVSSGDAVVFKLEYAVNDPDYGGTVNNGYLFSSFDQP
jgi:hypothetical protein